MRRVLVLRPEPGASTTARRARERGLDPIALPLFEVEPVDWQAAEASGFDGLLITSANAVRHAGEGLHALRGLPVYAVGSATAEIARDAGFDVASAGDSGVERLLGSIEPELKLLHLAGSL
jgi:uroporphyrinogen-III synthase